MARLTEEELLRNELDNQIEAIRQRICKNTGEDPKDVLRHISQYDINIAKNRLIKSFATLKWEDLELYKEAVEFILSHEKEITSDILNYGNKRNKLLYKYYGRLPNVKKALTGKLGSLLEYLNDKYSSDIGQVRMAYLGCEDSYEEFTECEIAQHFGNEYEIEAVSLILNLIAYELEKSIKLERIKTSLNNIISDMEDSELKLSLDQYYYYSHGLGICTIMEAIHPILLFRILDYNFIDKYNWPYQDNLIELLRSRLKDFNFNKNTYIKTKLLGCKKYKNIDIDKAIHLMILKNAL